MTNNVNNAIPIRLTEAEIYIAYAVAAHREINALRGKLQNAHGAGNGYQPEKHIIGCMGEVAAARALNLCWQDHGTLRGVDVGGLVEVRGTRRQPASLRMYDNDKDERPYLLADVTTWPLVLLVGWMRGRDGKKFPTGRPDPNRPPVHLVPGAVLHPCHELKPELLDRFK